LFVRLLSSFIILGILSRRNDETFSSDGGVILTILGVLLLYSKGNSRRIVSLFKVIWFEVCLSLKAFIAVLGCQLFELIFVLRTELVSMRLFLVLLLQLATLLAINMFTVVFFTRVIC